MALVVKNSPAKAGDARDAGSILGQENPLEMEMETQSTIPSHGQRSLPGYSPWGCKDSDVT